MSFNNPYAKKRSYKGMVVMHKLYENLDLEHQSSNSIWKWGAYQRPVTDHYMFCQKNL